MKRVLKRVLLIVFALLVALPAAAPAFAQGSGGAGSVPTGLWDAAVVVNGLEIPFRFEVAGDGSSVRGWFFNGDEKVESTGGKYENGALVLSFDHYATAVEASLVNGRLAGTYNRANGYYPFYARRFAPPSAFPNEVPAIDGLWQIGNVRSNKGESAWRFIVRQSGAEVTAAILRVDGDTGALAGTYRNGKFVVSHFSGARPLVLELTPQKDGTLEIVRNREEKMVAVRATDAKLKDVPEPTDPSRHSSVKDPTEPFKFSFPDVNGKVLSNTDERFRNKVVIVSISGSWCPNCHDEALFLKELLASRGARGLEVIQLMFERTTDFESSAKAARDFADKFSIDYPVLVAGTVTDDDLLKKLPQVARFRAYPTLFMIDRKGIVREIHTGFAGPAAGRYHEEQLREMTALVDGLLDEPA